MTGPSSPAGGSFPLWRTLATFLVSFFVLQQSWEFARGSHLEHWVIDGATVRTSVMLIDALTPGALASARGASIVAPGGGINVRAGCEGTEVLFLLTAGLLAYPFRARVRVAGLVAGILFTFAINQLRLLALFYSFRSDRALFEQLHGLFAPLALIGCTLIFFVGLLDWDRRLRADAAA